MKLFRCERCQAVVFFDNVQCMQCQAWLGFVPAEQAMGAFEPPVEVAPPPEAAVAEAMGGAGVDEPASEAADTPADAPAAPSGPPAAAELPFWQRLGPAGALRPCANRLSHAVCNWMLDEGDPGPLCRACVLSEVIPTLDRPDNLRRWAIIEQAKRRLLYTLLQLRLDITPRSEASGNVGLAFRLLEDQGPQAPVMTGHDHGVITLNIAEADDARREAIRVQMNEPLRTLVGHFRHESGHYYWERLIEDSPLLSDFRALFGDERQPYDEALKAYYASGPAPDWMQTHISAYATSHPWEDWAECWAHYLHLVDGLETAHATGLRLHPAGGEPVVPRPIGLDTAAIEPALLGQWLPVAQMLNAMNRSLGQPDGYPFLMPNAVVAKLAFVHRVVQRSAPRPTGAADWPGAAQRQTPLTLVRETAGSSGEPAAPAH